MTETPLRVPFFLGDVIGLILPYLEVLKPFHYNRLWDAEHLNGQVLLDVVHAVPASGMGRGAEW